MSERIDPLLHTPPEPTDDPSPTADRLPDAPAEAPVDASVDDLPGADRPEWLLPSLVVAFAALISWLAIFGPDDGGRPATESDQVAPAVADEAPGAEGDEAAGPVADDAVAGPTAGAASTSPGADPTAAPTDDGGPDVDGAVVDPIGDAEAEASATTAPDAVADLDLPAVGTIRVGDAEYPILRSCVGLRPFAPADDGDVVSAHVFSPEGEGSEQVIERWVTGDGIGGVRVDGAGSAGVRQVSVVDGPDGAFTASLERPDGQVVDVALVPLPEAERDCTDAVVTNEPGQLAFPHTRAALVTCVSGDPAVDGRVLAVLTEGARIEAVGNGDGTSTLVLRAPETLSSEPLDLTDPASELFVDGTRLGWSGSVTDGELARDITFDVDVAGARACSDADAVE